jgi:hypothetical protein
MMRPGPGHGSLASFYYLLLPVPGLSPVPFALHLVLRFAFLSRGGSRACQDQASGNERITQDPFVFPTTGTRTRSPRLIIAGYYS